MWVVKFQYKLSISKTSRLYITILYWYIGCSHQLPFKSKYAPLCISCLIIIHQTLLWPHSKQGPVCSCSFHHQGDIPGARPSRWVSRRERKGRSMSDHWWWGWASRLCHSSCMTNQRTKSDYREVRLASSYTDLKLTLSPSTLWDSWTCCHFWHSVPFLTFLRKRLPMKPISWDARSSLFMSWVYALSFCNTVFIRYCY